MKEVKIASWSNVLPTKTNIVKYSDDIIKSLEKPFIPRGSGRSFGDQAYISNGITLSSVELRQISDFDREKGTLVCGSGVQMVDLFNYLDATEWSFPVGGGTQWVTMGGAVASDINGKSDVIHGSFGNHVESIQIVIADGQQLECSKDVNSDLFSATIGGMGLTGFIKNIKLKLQKSISNVVLSRSKHFIAIEDMIAYFENTKCDLQVAWLDLTTSSPRGIYHYASFVEGHADDLQRPIEMKLPRIKLFNRLTFRFMTAIRYRLQKNTNKITHFRNFHYPVDILKHWNMLFGPKGFQEYQFVVPVHNMKTAYTEFFKVCKKFSLPPFPLIADIKKFGDIDRCGLLSFPKAGITMKTVFESKPDNQKLFTFLTDLLLELEGTFYLAKDSYLSKQQFEKMENNLEKWRDIVRKYDPQNRVKSDLSIRLGMKPW
jgi:FAD/FMN-containing dehydrogenase